MTSVNLNVMQCIGSYVVYHRIVMIVRHLLKSAQQLFLQLIINMYIYIPFGYLR